MARIVLMAVLCLMVFSGCWENDKRVLLLLALAKNYGYVAPTFVNAPSANDEFNFAWEGSSSPDGLWRRSSWVATGGNLFTWENAVTQPSYTGATGGVLLLTVQSASPGDTPYEGGEIQSVGDSGSTFGYGYYETRMKVTGVSGCCVSFFWIQSPGYGPGEIDIEFLTNETWTPDGGTVHFTLHPSEISVTQSLPFNPSSGFHRYGFLWTSSRVVFTVDGNAVRTFTSGVPAEAPGYIMANAWTGNAYWGGGPPSEDATSVYDWIQFYPDAVAIP
ncbi:MAG: glycoside hydrolase family 16 protein [Spirochaetes bacterium]|nr:glycoside hydrolase family 16 protein [Spirochaetota bacterium]